MAKVPTHTRFWLRCIQDDVARAMNAGVDPELILDAVAGGIEGARYDDGTFGSSPLALSLTRAMHSSVGPTMGGSGPTEELDTSAGPVDAVPPASEGPHAPGPAEASDSNWILTPRDGTAERTSL